MSDEDLGFKERPLLFGKCARFKYSQEMAKVGLNPYFQPVEKSWGPDVTINGRNMVMIGSNNYLGLASDTRVHEAAKLAIDQYGTSLNGSRFLNGSCNLHVELERELADFLGKESALVFTTGMQANLGVISSLIDRRTVAFIDKLDHASIYDGVKLSNGTMVRFGHNHVRDLELEIEHVVEDPSYISDGNTIRPKSLMIVVDGVFSMEGDLANLPEIVKVKREHNACLIVDDAHAIGTIGDTGRGSGEYHGCNRDIDLVVGTFSKSLASIGGFAVGPADVIEYIRYHARSMIFSCGLPPANTAAALTALRILRDNPELAGRASASARKVRNGLREMGYEVTGDDPVPIISIVIGDDVTTFTLWADLCRRGLFTNVVIGPATTPNRQLIRISFTAAHTERHTDFVLEQFYEAGQELGLIDVESGDHSVAVA